MMFSLRASTVIWPNSGCTLQVNILGNESNESKHVFLTEQIEPKQSDITYLPFIQEFGIVVNNIKHEFIFKQNDTSLPKWTKFLKRSCSLLMCAQPNLQLWGYKMLHTLIPGLIKIDEEAVNTNTPHRKGLIFEQFKEKLVETHGIVNSMLIEFKLVLSPLYLSLVNNNYIVIG